MGFELLVQELVGCVLLLEMEDLGLEGLGLGGGLEEVGLEVVGEGG